MIQYKCKIMMKKVGNITLYQLPENFLNFLSKFYVYNQSNSKITYEKIYIDRSRIAIYALLD